MAGREHYQAGDQTMLRQINLSAIMSFIRVDAPISRYTLAKKTGLYKATVTSLIDELNKRNFIKEIGLDSNHLGLCNGWDCHGLSDNHISGLMPVTAHSVPLVFSL